MDTARRVKPLLPTDPHRLGHYRLLGRLGSGGMGVVYLAETPGRTLVAVKLVHSMYAGDQEFLGRFRSEINRARQVPAYCTAEVLDADVDHWPPYLVVEYVDGPSLSEVVEERGPLIGRKLHSVAVGVATALTGIHGAGVIHRDLKPDNVLLPPGSPKLIDFGIAKAFEATSRHTRTDQFVGTVAYMAPERFDNGPGMELTPAADVFAWGCIVAYAATGRTPFQGDTPTVTAARILTQPPYLDGIQEPLRGLIERALAKEPVDRPTAQEILDALSAAPRRGRPAPGTRMARRAEARKRRRRFPLVAAAGALAAAGLAGAVLISGSPLMPAPEPAGGVQLPSGEAAGAATAPPVAGRASRSAVTEEGPSDLPPVKPSGLSHADRMDRFIDETAKACVLENDTLIISASSSGEFPCGDDNEDEFDLGTQSVTISSAVYSGDACLGYWFHWSQASGGDLIRICREEVTVGSARFVDNELYGRLVVPSPPPAAQRFTTRADITDDAVTFYRDGRKLGTIRLDKHPREAGLSVLGMIAQGERGGSPFRVMVFDIDVVRI